MKAGSRHKKLLSGTRYSPRANGQATASMPSELDGLVFAGAPSLLDLQVPLRQVIDLDLGATSLSVLMVLGCVHVNLICFGQGDDLALKQHKVCAGFPLSVLFPFVMHAEESWSTY